MQSFTRDILHKRHHLSHQQTDELLHEKRSMEFPEIKIEMLQKLNEFHNISKILYDAGIPFIVLKGPLLSWRIYKDPTFRTYNDADLLFETEALKKAIREFEKHGYRSWLFEWPKNKRLEDKLLKNTNQILFYHPDSPLLVELHWQLLKFSIRKKEKLKQLLSKNLQPVEYNNTTYTTFNEEMELLYLIIHGTLHAWQRLKWLVDVYDYLKQVSYNEAKLKQLIGEFHAWRIVALCNALLEKYFEAPVLLPHKRKVSPRLLRYAVKRIESEHYSFDDSYKALLDFTCYRMACFPGIRYKQSVLNGVLFSPGQLDASRISGSRLTDTIKRTFQKTKRNIGHKT